MRLELVQDKAIRLLKVRDLRKRKKKPVKEGIKG